MASPEYRHLVEAEDRGTRHRRLYDGTDAADAMAAWSRAVSEGLEYVMIESLACPRSRQPQQPAMPVLITVQHGSETIAHDGFAAHSHEVRPDHLGVPRADS